MSKITPEVIEEVAALARLGLTENEKQMYAQQLSVIFEYVDMLQSVDTQDVEGTSQVTGLEDVFRDDVVVDCDQEARKKMILMFPERVGNLLQVKAVFTE